MDSFSEVFNKAEKTGKISQIYKIANEYGLPPNLVRIFEYEKKNGFVRVFLIFIIRNISGVVFTSRYANSSIINDALLFIGNIFDINATDFLKEMDKDFVKSVLLPDFHKMLSKLDDETLIENRRVINNYYLSQLKIWNSYNKFLSEISYSISNIIYPIISNTKNQNIQTIGTVIIYVILELIVRYKFVVKDKTKVFDEIDIIKNSILKYTTEILNNNNIIVEFDTIKEHANTITDLISNYIDKIYDNDIFICPDYTVGNVEYDILEKALFIVTKWFLPYDPALYASLFYSFPTVIKGLIFVLADIESNMYDNIAYDKILAIQNDGKEFNPLFEQSTNLFTICNLEKSYGKNLLFSNGNLSIPQGKWISFIGNSGCGKSTFIKMLLKKEKFDSGRILFCDKYDEYNYKNICDAISNVKNTGDLFDNTVFYNITYGMKITAKLMDTVKFYMKKFNMEEVSLIDKVSSISSGQQQRIKIIRMILNDKPVWIMDESTSNIDNETEYNILSELKRIQIERKKTVIHITHNLENSCFADLCMQIKNKYISIVEK